MAASFFGEFLLKKGLINQAALDEVLEVQRRSNIMLGQIAVYTGMLSEVDADRINLRQQITNKRFGEIARELGIFDQSQVDELLLKQQKQRKYFGELLVEMGYLNKPQLEEQLAAHDREQKQAYQYMLDSIDQHPLADYLTAAMNTSNRLFLRFLHAQSKFAQLLDTSKNLPSMEVACQINIEAQSKDERATAITFAANAGTTICIASKFTHQQILDCDLEFSLDAFGEFLNIVVGHMGEDIFACASRPRSGAKLNVNLAELCLDATQMLAVEMDSQIGSFLIIISD